MMMIFKKQLKFSFFFSKTALDLCLVERMKKESKAAFFAWCKKIKNIVFFWEKNKWSEWEKKWLSREFCSCLELVYLFDVWGEKRQKRKSSCCVFYDATTHTHKNQLVCVCWQQNHKLERKKSHTQRKVNTNSSSSRSRVFCLKFFVSLKCTHKERTSTNKNSLLFCSLMVFIDSCAIQWAVHLREKVSFTFGLICARYAELVGREKKNKNQKSMMSRRETSFVACCFLFAWSTCLKKSNEREREKKVKKRIEKELRAKKKKKEEARLNKRCDKQVTTRLLFRVHFLRTHTREKNVPHTKLAAFFVCKKPYKQKNEEKKLDSESTREKEKRTKSDPPPGFTCLLCYQVCCVCFLCDLFASFDYSDSDYRFASSSDFFWVVVVAAAFFFQISPWD